jgi:predicted DNA-binding transcriptional regulator YafY
VVRADRLVAIILLLQTRGQLTAGELAELLDTSERTVRRDLDALLTAGVPLYSQRGRGGGWALLGGHRLNLTGFTVEEAQALFLVAGTGSSAVAGVETALS